MTTFADAFQAGGGRQRTSDRLHLSLDVTSSPLTRTEGRTGSPCPNTLYGSRGPYDPRRELSEGARLNDRSMVVGAENSMFTGSGRRDGGSTQTSLVLVVPVRGSNAWGRGLGNTRLARPPLPGPLPLRCPCLPLPWRAPHPPTKSLC